MECSYSERRERNQHLKGVIQMAERRMGEAAAAVGRCEQVGTEPSRAQSQAPSNAPVTASQTSEPLLIGGKETWSTDAADDLPLADDEAYGRYWYDRQHDPQVTPSFMSTPQATMQWPPSYRGGPGFLAGAESMRRQ